MKTNIKFHLLILGFASAGLLACSSHEVKNSSQPIANSSRYAAVVDLLPKSGSKVSGHLDLATEASGVLITGTLRGLTPGAHGFHIHEKGDCSAADASSAGGHFHYEGQMHGPMGGKSSHSGDFGNIEADKNGVAHVKVHVKKLNLVPKKDASIIGLAIVVHEKQDDLKSQPAGNSGARIACGLIISK